MSLRPSRKLHPYEGLTLVTAPAAEPVALADLKAFLEYTESDKDDLLNLLIEDARTTFENYTGRALISQVWRLALDRWPTLGEPWWDGMKQGAVSELAGFPAEVELPKYKLISVDSVTVYDDSGTSSAVVVADTFIVDTAREPGRIVLKSGKAWPVALQRANAVEIEFTAGYGANATDVPASIRQALMKMAAYQFEHRGSCESMDAFKMSGAKAVADQYRIVRV